MPSTINANNTTGLVSTADTSGILQLQTNGTTAVTIDASQRAAFVAGTAALPAITTTGDTNTGIFFPAADTIAFAEGGAESMRIDSLGSVLVGTTTSPSSNNMRLSVAGRSGSVSNAGMQLITDGGGGGALFSNDGAGLRMFSFTGVAGSESYTERARIDSSGRLLVGTTSQSGKVAIKPAANSYNEGLGLIASNSSNVWNFLVSTDNSLYFGYQNADRGYFNPSTGAYTAVSDQRLKKNITDIQYGLNEVLSLRPVSYNMNQQADTDPKALGFIAQESMQVIPESVSEMMGGMYGMDKVTLIPVLVKAIQEQQTLIESLKARLDAANL